MRNATIKVLLLLAALSLTACGAEQIDSGYRGIYTEYGAVTGEPLAEGLHFYNPFTADIFEYPVREQMMTGKSVFQSKDNQRVTIEFSVTYRPDPNKVTALWTEYGRPDQLATIIEKDVLGAAKDAVGTTDAETINSKRNAVVDAALKEVQITLAKRNIQVTGLQFTDITFDQDFTNAIEAKATAVILAQKAVNDTERIKEEKQQAIFKAEGEARAMQIKSEALAKNKGLVAFEMVQKWDGTLPRIVMGANSIPMFNMNDILKDKE